MKSVRQLGRISMNRRETTPFDPETGHSFPNFTYGYVAEAIDLEVDVDTGQIKLLNAICTIDVGKAINPQQLEGQIEGCMIQVMGHALMEGLDPEGWTSADEEVINVFDPDGAGHS